MNTAWKHKVIRNFDRGAQDYDGYSGVQKSVAQKLVTDLPDACSILEIGCGTGNLTQEILNKYKNAKFCITDISPVMIEKVKHNIGCFDRRAREGGHTSPDPRCLISLALQGHGDDERGIEWKVLDGENPVASKQYDLIVSNMTFQWFENIEKSLDKLVSLLKPNGSLFYTMPGPESFKEWRHTLCSLNFPVGLIDLSKPPGIYREEHKIQQYKNTIHFLRVMKQAGAGTARKNYMLLTPTQLKQACALCDKDYDGRITWHILYGCIRH